MLEPGLGNGLRYTELVDTIWNLGQVWLGNTRAGLRLKLRGSDTAFRADNLVTDAEYYDTSATPETAGSSPLEAPLGTCHHTSLKHLRITGAHCMQTEFLGLFV